VRSGPRDIWSKWVGHPGNHDTVRNIRSSAEKCLGLLFGNCLGGGGPGNNNVINITAVKTKLRIAKVKAVFKDDGLKEGRLVGRDVPGRLLYKYGDEGQDADAVRCLLFVARLGPQGHSKKP
jgi:hypothetical protein